MLQASCTTLRYLSVFSFQQYITAITHQPHKHVARLNPFVSHLATNLRNADCCCCYDYDYYYCHFGTALSQPWMFCYDICTYPNLQPTLKHQFPQKIFLFFGHSILDLHPQRPLEGGRSHAENKRWTGHTHTNNTTHFMHLLFSYLETKLLILILVFVKILSWGMVGRRTKRHIGPLWKVFCFSQAADQAEL